MSISEVANVAASISNTYDGQYLELMIAYLESIGCLLQVNGADGGPAVLTKQITAQFLAILDWEGAVTHSAFTQMCDQILQSNSIPFSASITAQKFLNILVQKSIVDTININEGDTLFILKNRSKQSKMTTVELEID